MSGRPFGTVVRRTTQRGTTYGLRITVDGRKVYEHLGGDWEGWTEQRVAERRAEIGEAVRRGEYGVPDARRSVPGDARRPSFEQWAATWLARRSPGWADSTSAHHRWLLDLAIGQIGSRPLTEIGPREIAAMRDALLAEREVATAARKSGEPIYHERIDPVSGTEFRRVYRGQSASTIKAVLKVVTRCLRDAVAEGLIESNPAVGEAVRIKVNRPEGSHLNPMEIASLVRAARDWDKTRAGLTEEDVRAIQLSREPAVRLREQYGVSDVVIGRARRGEYQPHSARETSRELLVLLLAFTGVRVTEACLLDHSMVDIAAGTVHVPRLKTDASARVVPLVPSLRAALAHERATRRADPRAPVLSTKTGGRLCRSQLERRLHTVHEKSTPILVDAGLGPIEHLTPHTLRRTFASIASVVGVPPRRCMELLGHTDPEFTMRVYARPLQMSQGAVLALERLMQCDFQDARGLFEGREPRDTLGHYSDTWRVGAILGGRD